MSDASRSPEVSTDPNEWVSIDYVHDQVEAMMSRQWDAFETMERRFAQVLAFVSALTVAGIAFLPERIATDISTRWVTFVGLLFLLFSGGVALWGFLPRRWTSAPNPHTLRSKYLTTNAREVRLVVTDSRIVDFERNKKSLDRQVWLFRASVALLFTGTLLFVVAAGMSTTPKGL